MSEHQSGFPRLGLILLAALTLGWGFNWPIMKIVLSDVPPLTFRAICLLGGGIGVLLIARLGRQSLAIPRGYVPQLLALSATNIIGWNVLIIYGLGLLPSGRAALLAYTMPLWSVLLSVWLLRERLTAGRVAALALGMAGVVVMMSGELGKFGGAPHGVALVLGAAAMWGLGIVLLKRFAVPMPTVSLTGWTMLWGAIPITIAALVFEADTWRPVGLYPALGVLYNVFVAFMFCYWAWNRIVLMVPVAVSSLSSLVTPMVGVGSSMLLLNEALTWRETVAGMLIIGAIALVVRPARRAPEPAPSRSPVA